MPKLTNFVFSIFLVLFATPATAQPAREGDAIQIYRNAQTFGGLVSAPALAGNDAGQAVVAWSAGIAEQRFMVMARRLVGGQPIGDDIEVGETLAAFLAPIVAMSASGEFVVLWPSREAGGQLASRAFASDGTARGPAYQIGGQALEEAKICAVRGGGYALVRFRDRQVLFDRLDAEARPFGNQTPLEGASRQADIACLENGSSLVVWQEVSTSSSDPESFFAQRFASDVLTPPFVAISEAQAAALLTVGVSPDGDWMMAWRRDGRLLARFFAADDSPRGPVVEVAAFDDFSQPHTIDIIFDSERGFTILWTHDDFFGRSGPVMHLQTGALQGRSFAVSGQPLGEPYLLLSHWNGDRHTATAVATAGDRLLTGWAQQTRLAPDTVLLQSWRSTGPGRLRFAKRTIAAPESRTRGSGGVETSGIPTFTVERIDGSEGVVSVDYELADGTATAADVVSASGQIVFADGDSRPRAVALSIVEDGLVEGSESLQLRLANPVGATLAAPSAMVLEIGDSDLRAGIEPRAEPVFVTDGLRNASSVGQAIAANRHGEVLLAWIELTDQLQVMSQRFDADDQPLGDAFELKLGGLARTFSDAPRALLGDDGSAAVAWRAIECQFERCTSRAVLRRLADGNWSSSPPFPEGNVHFALTQLANGELVLLEARQNGIFEHRLLAGNELRTTPLSSAATNPATVAVAAGPAGRAMLLWEQPFDGQGPGIVGVGSAASGTVAAPYPINEQQAGAQSRPDVAAAANGRYLAVWESLTADGESAIMARRIDVFGNLLDRSVVVSLAPGRQAVRPRVAASDSGDFLVVWEQWNPNPGASPRVVLFAQLLDSEVRPVGAPLRLTAAQAAPLRYPAVAAAGDEFVVMWREGPERDQLYYQRFVPRSHCRENATTLCLQRRRFAVEVDWRNPRAVQSGRGLTLATSSSDDSGYFWFFDPANIELAVKVLDGRATNDRFWIFVGALTDIEFTLRVTDTWTGEVKTYFNPAFRQASFADTDAFEDLAPWPAALPARLPSPHTTGKGATRIGRFEVAVTWRDFAGNRGEGRAMALTSDTSAFWFFDPDNTELIIKILDGIAVNGYHWVFYGALSNVEYEITVTDTESGTVTTYFNALGEFASVGDTEAFIAP